MPDMINISELIKIVKEMEKTGLGNNNKSYKKSIFNALSLLAGDAIFLAEKMPKLMDILWKVKIFDENISDLYIVIKAKCGKTIVTFDERKIKTKLLNTISYISKTQIHTKNILLWFWIVNGNVIPSNESHGGFRNSSMQVSFKEKLFKTQVFLQKLPQIRIAKVTAFSLNCFIEYYNYLFRKLFKDAIKSNLLDHETISEFWTWGSLFSQQFQILSNVRRVKEKLY